MLTFLAGVPGILSAAWKALPAILGALVVLIGLLAWHEHKVADEASEQLSTARAQTIQAQAEIAAQAKDNADTITALNRLNRAALSRAIADGALKAKAHAAPQTNACAVSPAIRTVLDGLRGSAVPSNKHPAAPGSSK